MSKVKLSPNQKLLIRIPELAALLSLSVTHTYELMQTGQLPEPTATLGRARLFDRRLIELWIDMGCPSQEKFEKLRKGKK